MKDASRAFLTVTENCFLWRDSVSLTMLTHSSREQNIRRKTCYEKTDTTEDIIGRKQSLKILTYWISNNLFCFFWGFLRVFFLTQETNSVSIPKTINLKG